VIVFTIAGALRPGYSPIRDVISVPARGDVTDGFVLHVGAR